MQLIRLEVQVGLRVSRVELALMLGEGPVIGDAPSTVGGGVWNIANRKLAVATWWGLVGALLVKGRAVVRHVLGCEPVNDASAVTLWVQTADSSRVYRITLKLGRRYDN